MEGYDYPEQSDRHGDTPNDRRNSVPGWTHLFENPEEEMLILPEGSREYMYESFLQTVPSVSIE